MAAVPPCVVIGQHSRSTLRAPVRFTRRLRYGKNILNMSNSNSTMSCVVPKCKSTTINAPEKLFFLVPFDVQMRKKWIKAMRRLDPFGSTSRVFCCQDHFDIENDMENYIKYKLMGGRLKLKKGTLPHKFECQRKYLDTHLNKDEEPIPAILDAPHEEDPLNESISAKIKPDPKSDDAHSSGNVSEGVDEIESDNDSKEFVSSPTSQTPGEDPYLTIDNNIKQETQISCSPETSYYVQGTSLVEEAPQRVKTDPVFTDEDDKNFLLSFRSDMRRMTPGQKLDFKLGMLKLTKQIFSNEFNEK